MTKTKTQDTTEVVRVRLQDECQPQIGSGVRIVRILSRGPKWVRVAPLEGGNAKKIARSLWDQIERTAETEWPGKGKRRRRSTRYQAYQRAA